jgi:hypothetical protein
MSFFQLRPFRSTRLKCNDRKEQGVSIKHTRLYCSNHYAQQIANLQLLMTAV